MKEKLRTWIGYALPPVIWLMVVLSFSSGSFSADTSGRFIERLLRCCWPSLLARLTRPSWAAERGGAEAGARDQHALAVLCCERTLVWRPAAVGWVLASARRGRGRRDAPVVPVRTAAATDVLLDCGEPPWVRWRSAVGKGSTHVGNIGVLN